MHPLAHLSVKPRILLAAALILTTPVFAQLSAPPNTANSFKDTSMVKPPAGAKVAIYEFEDLECPACSHAFPIVHAAVEKYNIPLVRHDFPLKMHIWSRDAAIIARLYPGQDRPQGRRRLPPRRLRSPGLHRLQRRPPAVHAEVLPVPRSHDALRRRPHRPVRRRGSGRLRPRRTHRTHPDPYNLRRHPRRTGFRSPTSTSSTRPSTRPSLKTRRLQRPTQN